jgi:hypothetical protein
MIDIDDIRNLKQKYRKIIKNDNNLSSAPKIFETLYALELDMMLWEDIPDSFIEKHELPHKRDFGIDLISWDFKSCAQVKKTEKSRITWSKVANFVTYCDILNIENMILATITNPKIDKLVKEKLIKTNKIKLIENNYTNLLNKYTNNKIYNISNYDSNEEQFINSNFLEKSYNKKNVVVAAKKNVVVAAKKNVVVAAKKNVIVKYPKIKKVIKSNFLEKNDKEIISPLPIITEKEINHDNIIDFSNINYDLPMNNISIVEEKPKYNDLITFPEINYSIDDIYNSANIDNFDNEMLNQKEKSKPNYKIITLLLNIFVPMLSLGFVTGSGVIVMGKVTKNKKMENIGWLLFIINLVVYICTILITFTAIGFALIIIPLIIYFACITHSIILLIV